MKLLQHFMLQQHLQDCTPMLLNLHWDALRIHATATLLFIVSIFVVFSIVVADLIYYNNTTYYKNDVKSMIFDSWRSPKTVFLDTLKVFWPNLKNMR